MEASVPFCVPYVALLAGFLLAGRPREQRRAARARRQQRSKENHRIDAGLPLRGPVNIAQVEPQRELVESQRGADAIQH
jgi:hypothetical protein